MAITSVPPVSSFSLLAAINTLRWPGSTSATDLATQLLAATPSTIVTLGAGIPAPLLYNAAGLLTSLLQADPINSVTPDPGRTAAQLQSYLAPLLGLTPDTTSSGLANASGLLGRLSVETTQALNNVLTRDTHLQGADNQSLALNEVLSTALDFSTTELAIPTVATGVIEAAPNVQRAPTAAVATTTAAATPNTPAVPSTPTTEATPVGPIATAIVPVTTTAETVPAPVETIDGGLPGLAVDEAARAISNTEDPIFAAVTATLYLRAAISRSPSTSATDLAPNLRTEPIPPVQQVPSRKVSVG